MSYRAGILLNLPPSTKGEAWTPLLTYREYRGEGCGVKSSSVSSSPDESVSIEIDWR